MFACKCYFRQFFSLAAAFLFLGFLAANAQDETLADIRYREDYERTQRIFKINQPVKRADQILLLYKDRADLDPRLREYTDSLFVQDMQNLMKQKNFVALRGLCDRAIKLRPKFGEAYFFLGVVLKNEKKIDEAMNAFAKCHLIKNPFQIQAKQQLDMTYRAVNKGSIVGQDKLINNARKELK